MHDVMHPGTNMVHLPRMTVGNEWMANTMYPKLWQHERAIEDTKT